jgi:hypothetical protein
LTITEWTNLNYEPLKEACHRISEGNELGEELLHYVLSEFLNKPNVQEIIQSGGAFWFCLKMVTNSWKSTTSPFYRMYRDPNFQGELPDVAEEAPEQDEIQQRLLEVAEEGMKGLGWYEKELLQVYAEHGANASLVSRLTKIPRTSINLTIRKIKRHINQIETNGRQNNKIDMKDIVYYTLGDHEEILQSERGCLEGTIQEDKFRLGLSPFAEYKELKDYAPPESHPELTSYLSAICDPNKPTMVAKPTRKSKSKQKANELLPVQLVLDHTNPLDLVPGVLRDRFTRSNNTISDGMDK